MHSQQCSINRILARLFCWHFVTRRRLAYVGPQGKEGRMCDYCFPQTETHKHTHTHHTQYIHTHFSPLFPPSSTPSWNSLVFFFARDRTDRWLAGFLRPHDQRIHPPGVHGGKRTGHWALSNETGFLMMVFWSCHLPVAVRRRRLLCPLPNISGSPKADDICL